MFSGSRTPAGLVRVVRREAAGTLARVPAARLRWGLQGPQVGQAGWGSFMVNRTACPSWCELVMTGRLDEGLVGDPVGVNRTAWTFFPSCTACRLRATGRSGWQIQQQLPYRLSVCACRAGWAGWGSYEVNRTARTARSWLVRLVGDPAGEPYCLYCLCRAG